MKFGTGKMSLCENMTVAYEGGVTGKGKKGLSVMMVMYILRSIRVLQVYAIVKTDLYTKEMCISWNIYYFSIKILKVKIK